LNLGKTSLGNKINRLPRIHATQRSMPHLRIDLAASLQDPTLFKLGSAFASRVDSLGGCINRQVQQEQDIRGGSKALVPTQDLLPIQTAASLIRSVGKIVPIQDHNLPCRKARLDETRDVLLPVEDEQLQLFLSTEPTKRGGSPETTSMRAVRGLTIHPQRNPQCPQGLGQKAHLGAFTRPVNPFEHDEDPPAHRAGGLSFRRGRCHSTPEAVSDAHAEGLLRIHAKVLDGLGNQGGGYCPALREGIQGRDRCALSIDFKETP
jgi:hypothetical protein